MGKSKSRNRNKERDSNYLSQNRFHRDEEEGSDSEDSVSTHLTFDEDMRSVQGEFEEEADIFMDALAEHIQNASEKKSISVRTAALRHLQLALTSRYIPDWVEKWKETLVDLVAKNLRKTDEETVIAAYLLALISIQINEEISDSIEDCLSTMRTIVTDPSRTVAVRTTCALSLAITTHLSCTNDDSTANTVKSLRSVWTTRLSTINPLVTIATLSAWALCLQDAHISVINSAMLDQPRLYYILESDNHDVRLAAGEILAYLYEIARENGVREFSNHNQVEQLLQKYATEASRSRAKKDKRIQRFTFRQIYASICDEEPPSLAIKSGREVLQLSDNSHKLLYDLLVQVLRGGMMRQIQQNKMLRELFDMEETPAHVPKMDKSTRMAIHEENTKERNRQRGKLRDKRSDFY
ncbi:hypothetical protein WR25_05899 [Diploscapter pachys]|uniref:Interferon-related developmental regulator N-terminal domain-containing protein n=1 Tax=Diploscapter pachys TaxID=2018661 RepID=A0A2A2KF00_9BILA|nr:hypothetical protein WR25_05899 [Diploscapter pachys]